MPLVVFSAIATPTVSPIVLGLGNRLTITVDAGRDLGPKRWKLKNVQGCSSLGTADVTPEIIATYMPGHMHIVPKFLNSPDKVVKGNQYTPRVPSCDADLMFNLAPYTISGNGINDDVQFVGKVDAQPDLDFGIHCVDSRRMEVDFYAMTVGNQANPALGVGLVSIDPRVVTQTLICVEAVFEYTDI